MRKTGTTLLDARRIDCKVNQIIKKDKTSCFDHNWHVRLSLPWGNYTQISLEQAQDYLAKSIGMGTPHPKVWYQKTGLLGDQNCLGVFAIIGRITLYLVIFSKVGPFNLTQRQ
jgi:hypothetical protein